MIGCILHFANFEKVFNHSSAQVQSSGRLLNFLKSVKIARQLKTLTRLCTLTTYCYRSQNMSSHAPRPMESSKSNDLLVVLKLTLQTNEIRHR